MGNCQAVDAAALVIQHPNGKLERWYWPISVSEVMRMNPGHYVSLIIPLPTSSGEAAQHQQGGSKDDTKPPPPTSQQQPQEKKTIRYTRVKLLRATDTLVLGRAYRLVTSQEVVKVMRAKKYAKMKSEQESAQRLHVINHHESRRSSTSGREREARKQQLATHTNQAMTNEREQSRTTQQQTTNPAAVGRSKSWRPSLQSISEATS